jgi:hypothetical protein
VQSEGAQDEHHDDDEPDKVDDAVHDPLPGNALFAGVGLRPRASDWEYRVQNVVCVAGVPWAGTETVAM